MSAPAGGQPNTPVTVRVSFEAALDGMTEARVAALVERAWSLYDGPRGVSVEVVFLDDAEHSRVHGEFLDDPSSTDVMAFGYEDADLFGEILVNRDVAQRCAEEHAHDAVAEAALYVVHGALHLLGFRDDESEARARMREAERRVLTE